MSWRHFDRVESINAGILHFVGLENWIFVSKPVQTQVSSAVAEPSLEC